MNEKYLLGIGLAAVAVLGIAFMVVAGVSTNDTPLPSVAAKAPVVPVQAQASASQPSPAPSSAQFQVVATNTSGIQDADLKNLASMVHLEEAKHQNPNKNQWTQALPVAQKMLDGTCDCEQRNWLKQFVEMGNYALSDSNQYYQSAQLMDTLPLNDQELNKYYNSK